MTRDKGINELLAKHNIFD